MKKRSGLAHYKNLKLTKDRTTLRAKNLHHKSSYLVFLHVFENVQRILLEVERSLSDGSSAVRALGIHGRTLAVVVGVVVRRVEVGKRLLEIIQRGLRNGDVGLEIGAGHFAFDWRNFVGMNGA